ncbi:hypothetical protein PIIN_07629 [Serendipita indica DSM 11827]|uniref:Uncharacterized protein n=1 Tax=Serendipita indica (strain DSM 11827) TaxID=1109443 RepID=G4TQT3_SERID|nr:hypothetical protein PIIN_07629 [Serendipita indica DSM 11827]
MCALSSKPKAVRHVKEEWSKRVWDALFVVVVMLGGKKDAAWSWAGPGVAVLLAFGLSSVMTKDLWDMVEPKVCEVPLGLDAHVDERVMPAMGSPKKTIDHLRLSCGTPVGRFASRCIHQNLFLLVENPIIMTDEFVTFSVNNLRVQRLG